MVFLSFVPVFSSLFSPDTLSPPAPHEQRMMSLRMMMMMMTMMKQRKEEKREKKGRRNLWRRITRCRSRPRRPTLRR